MTITNVVSGFRITSIYPCNRQALLERISTSSSLAEETGLAYIPIYSPSVRRTTSRTGHGEDVNVVSTGYLEFSEEEVDLFEEWFQEGLNVANDDRYSTWLSCFHPTSSAASHVWMRPVQSTGISRFLSYPTPPSKLPTFNPKTCGRVLTSQENLDKMEEKGQGGKAKGNRREEESKREVAEGNSA